MAQIKNIPGERLINLSPLLKPERKSAMKVGTGNKATTVIGHTRGNWSDAATQRHLRSWVLTKRWKPSKHAKAHRSKSRVST
jgi:hypothetical protein